MSKHKYRDLRLVVELRSYANPHAETEKFLDMSIEDLKRVTTFMLHDTEFPVSLQTLSSGIRMGREVIVRFNGKIILRIIP